MWNLYYAIFIWRGIVLQDFQVCIIQLVYLKLYINDFTEFSTKSHWNTMLAASDVFMFTQSIKFF